MLTLSLRSLVPGLRWKSSGLQWKSSGLQRKSSGLQRKSSGLQWKSSLSKDWNPGSIMGNDVRGREKVFHPAPALVEPLGPSSSLSRVESFSKFDGQQLCSPLIYRPHISIIERSKPVIKFIKILRGWQRFKGGLCPVKVTSF